MTSCELAQRGKPPFYSGCPDGVSTIIDIDVE